jgi:hypothetical protein
MTFGREILELMDGSYLLLADGLESTEDYAPMDLILMKTDSSGDLLWKNELGFIDSLFWRNQSAQMEVDSEDKLLIAFRSAPWSIANAHTNRLSRVDLEGNVLWTRSVSHTACGYYVKALPEGGSIIYGCKELPAPPAYIQPFIARLNDSGHELWTRFFALPLRFIYGMDLTPDGHLLMAGNYLADAGDVAWIAKYSVDGDSIWSRTYLMEGIPYVNYFFQDVKATADGGLIATGMLVDTMPGGHINPNTWVLKLDENGCFSDDCQQDITITTATREVTLRPFDQEDWFLLSPNPAVWELNLRLLRALPSRNGKLEMYDTSGRLVSDAHLDGNSFQPITFPVSAWPSGIYFMVLKDERGRVLQTKSWVKP